MAINIPPDQSGSGSKSPAVKSGSAAVSGTTVSGKDTSDAAGKVQGATDSPPRSQTESAVIKAIVAEVRERVQDKAQAIVQARQAAGQYSKPVYDAVVQLNPGNRQLSAPQSSSAQPPQADIDARLTRQILEGRPVAIRVETTAPLRTGQLLDVQLKDGSLKLLKVAPPPLQLSAQPLIRQEINLQNSYTQLLGKLMALMQTLRQQLPLTDSSGAKPPATTTADGRLLTPQSPPIKASPQPAEAQNPNAALRGNTPQSSAAPGKISFPGIAPARQTQLTQQLEQLVSRFIATLPTEREIASAEGLKQAVRNSGIFYESQLAKPERFAQPPAGNQRQSGDKASSIGAGQLLSGSANRSAKSSAGSAASGKPAELIQQIRQQIRSLTSSLNDGPMPRQGNAGNTGLEAGLARDLKYNLLQLESQLKQLQKDAIQAAAGDKTGTRATAEGSPKDPITGRPADADQPKSSPAEAGTKALDKNLDKVLLDPGRTKTDKGSLTAAAEQAARAAAESRRDSPVYQRPLPSGAASSSPALYQDEAADEGSKPRQPGKDWAQPPLPGKFHVQPQMIRPNLAASESLADALISVLIKHTREATSRLNLHQLASVTDRARPEAGPQQTMLSFELPILQGLDLSLFQFRIYDEDAHEQGKESGAAKEKKWVVHMGFDLEGLGPMYCQITLIGVSASVTFWAEDKETVAASQSHVNDLKKNLSKLGVNVKDIQCINGTPPSDQSGIQQTLIDIET